MFLSFFHPLEHTAYPKSISPVSLSPLPSVSARLYPPLVCLCIAQKDLHAGQVVLQFNFSLQTRNSKQSFNHSRLGSQKAPRYRCASELARILRRSSISKRARRQSTRVLFSWFCIVCDEIPLIFALPDRNGPIGPLEHYHSILWSRRVSRILADMQ